MPEVSADDLPTLQPLPIAFSGSLPMYGSMGSGYGSLQQLPGTADPRWTQQQLLQQEALLEQERERIYSAQVMLQQQLQARQGQAQPGMQFLQQEQQQQPFLARRAEQFSLPVMAMQQQQTAPGASNNGAQAAAAGKMNPLSFLQQRMQERFCYCPCMFGL
eukprot:g2735.t1